MHTIEPPPPVVISGVEWRMIKNADTMFLRRSSASSSPSNMSSGFIVPPPTTETAMARRSASAAVAAHAASTDFSSRPSPTKYSTFACDPAASWMRFFDSASVSSVRPMIMTAAPSRASHSADAPPMPPPPPVTNAAWPSNGRCVLIRPPEFGVIRTSTTSERQPARERKSPRLSGGSSRLQQSPTDNTSPRRRWRAARRRGVVEIRRRRGGSATCS